MGPVSFAELEIEQGRRQVTFIENPEESIDEIFKEWKPLEAELTYLVVVNPTPN